MKARLARRGVAGPGLERIGLAGMERPGEAGHGAERRDMDWIGWRGA